MSFFKTRLVVQLLWLGFAGYGQMAMAQSTGTFSATGNMTTPRGAHTATLLFNGKVLITGGNQHNQHAFPDVVLASAELYDPATGTFAPTGDMTMPRAGHSATLLADGRVLITGGRPGVASAELYDPSTGTFTATGDMINPSRSQTSTLLGNGKVLIAGGDFSAELYDPASGSFAPAGAYAESGTAFVETATLLADGKVQVTGYGLSFAAPKAELYDPSTDTFSVAGTMTGPMNYWWEDVNTATLLMNGKVLIAGDVENDGFPGVVEMYDPSLALFTNFGNTIAPHEFSTATLLPDGALLIAGGQLPGGNGSPGVDLFAPATGMFSAAPNMIAPRHEHTATLLRDGTVLIAGGFSMWPAPTASAEIYKPPAPQAAPVLLSLSGDGQGQGAIQHSNTIRIASAADPAVAGEYLTIYLTGLAEGSVIPPQVAIGGRLAPITFFGKVPGYPGLNVINVRMPTSVVPGPAVPVRLNYLGRPSNQVAIGVQ